ncbi:chaperone protein dnaJ 11 [Forsythia ovata]|uniref:Chaperone protein dnaJ 11 n=1 Tax=Forsythia ovata TaxID=205694 RepID=A0ABD1VLH8_9LAMI
MASSSFSLPNQIIRPKFSFITPPSPPCHVSFPRPPLRISATSSTAERGIADNAPQPASLYELLGIQMGASGHEIKTAYRRLARILHPDVASNVREDDTSAADQFMRVHAAYATLSDPEKRANYDQALSRWRWRPMDSRIPEASASASGLAGYTGRNRTWETDQCW